MNIGHLMTARLDVLYLQLCAVSPPYVNIFQLFGSISFACASSRKMICVFSLTKLLLKAFCLLIMAMFLDGMKQLIDMKRLVFLLLGSPLRHMTLSLYCLMWQLRSRM